MGICIQRVKAGLILLMFCGIVHSVELMPALSQEDYLQYKVWSVARDYRFGMTVAADRIQALAWQTIYVNRLPDTYPLKEKLLEPFRAAVSVKEQEEALIYSNIYREKFNLGYQFNEVELFSAYHSRDHRNTEIPLMFKSKCGNLTESTLDEWLREIKTRCDSKSAMEAEQRLFDLQASHGLPVIYGQVQVHGPVPPSQVSSNLPIMNQGLIAAQASDRTVYFSLPGYQTVIKKLNKSPLQGLGTIILKPSRYRDKTGFTGRIHPYSNSDDINVLVYEIPAWKAHSDPWHTAIIPLTVTQEGLFYARGLSKGKYRLLIKNDKTLRERVFTIQEGEIRSLSIIDLTKT